MRVEPYSLNSFVHGIKRGARGLGITREDADKWRFVRLLYYANDSFKCDNWERETYDLGIFGRPEDWPDRKPIVKILAWSLMPNHFHILFKEIQEGGISKFLQKLCGSMSMNFNSRYKEKGSIFQGAYKGRTVDNDTYLRYLAAYIMVKNVFELYPKGYSRAVTEFDQAWKWAIKGYPFSSLMDYATDRFSPIIEKDVLGEIFSSPEKFRDFARDMVEGRIEDVKV